jgi:hypothetical protein
MNNYTGEKTIVLGGKDYTICFDWRAISRVHSECGMAVLGDLLRASPEAIGVVLEAGLAKYHPEFKKEHLFDITPPLIPIVKAIDAAIHAAYFGPDDPDFTPEPENKKK